MSTCLTLNNDPELLKSNIKHDEIEDLKDRTGKHDHEIILKSLKKDSKY